MPEPRKILFATDFSESCRRAMRDVVLLSRLYGAEVTALHVQPSFWKHWVSSGVVERQAEERLQGWVQKLEAEGIAASEVRVRQGNPAEAVLHDAEANEVDLIVLGASEKKRRFGATGLAIARHARQSVWVSRGASEHGIRRVLCGVDTSEPAGRALEAAASLCRRSGAGLTILSAIDAPAFNDLGMTRGESEAATQQYREERFAELDAFVGSHQLDGIDHEKRYVWGAPHEVLRTLVTDDGFDLVVVGRTGRSGLRRLLLGSTAERLLHEPPCSLLLI